MASTLLFFEGVSLLEKWRSVRRSWHLPFFLGPSHFQRERKEDLPWTHFPLFLEVEYVLEKWTRV